jgi:hypothetical protein
MGAPYRYPTISFYIGGWPKMSGQRVDITLDTNTAQVTIFDFNNSTGRQASKFDRRIMDALASNVKENYGGSIDFKPGDERFCLGP